MRHFSSAVVCDGDQVAAMAWRKRTWRGQPNPDTQAVREAMNLRVTQRRKTPGKRLNQAKARYRSEMHGLAPQVEPVRERHRIDAAHSCHIGCCSADLDSPLDCRDLTLVELRRAPGTSANGRVPL